jgi:hypothetical protein
MTVFNIPQPWSILRLCFLAIVASVALLPAGSRAEPANGMPSFQYSTQASTPIIEYNLIHHMLAEPDPEPLLRIYGNGRVHVHYPDYMTKAGDYEVQLSQSELRALMRSLITDGIIDFDPAPVRSQRQQLDAQRRAATGTMFYISDSSDTVIDIRLNEYQKGPGTARVLNLEKRFIWPDLKQDAMRFPQLREITNANNAAQRLDTLMHREDLVKIK